MPPEYYLGAGVVLIMLVLLPFAFMRKRPKRRTVSQPSAPAVAESDELTRQLARVADGLETLLKHLKSMQLSPVPVARVERVAAVASPVTQSAPGVLAQAPQSMEAQAPPAQTPLPHDQVPEPVAQTMMEQPVIPASSAAVPEPPFAEPLALEPPVEEQPVKRRVKLSMFGR